MDFRPVESECVRNSPDWIKKSVIYELHIRAFTENGFTGLTENIDYFKKLGINTLWLMPFNEVGLEGRIGKYGDPYAVKNFYKIDPSFGTKDELLIGNISPVYNLITAK